MTIAHQDLGLGIRRESGAKAIAEFDKALKLDPSNPNVLKARGDTYLAQGDRDRAIADFTQAIRIDAKLTAAYVNRGVAYLGKSDWDLAIADHHCHQA
jgi:Tfp pilus assembly protein PilF